MIQEYLLLQSQAHIIIKLKVKILKLGDRTLACLCGNRFNILALKWHLSMKPICDPAKEMKMSLFDAVIS